ncbi:MAG: hypothetical protein Q7S22_05510 [Candidatus Micrarchaeota archaeon]|nr:hypothetical protein [Candidatus Micrarchaeota archaeon]
MTNLIFRPRIVPIAQNLPFIEARNAIAAQGGLPSNVLHDNYLVGSKRYQEMRSVYPVWSREILVYPERYALFKKGIDIVDNHKNDGRKEWIFPGSCVPKEVVGVENAGLFVDPESLEVSDQRVIVLAKLQQITVITPFIQINGECGIVDDATRVPLQMDQGLAQRIRDRKKRWLFRVDSAGVRPVVRDVSGFYSRRIIDAGYNCHGAFRVTYVTHDLIEINGKGKITKELARDVTVEDITKFAAGVIPDSLNLLTSVQLEAARLNQLFSISS